MSVDVRKVLEPYVEQARKNDAGLMVYYVDSYGGYHTVWFTTGVNETNAKHLAWMLSNGDDEAPHERGGVCLWRSRGVLAEFRFTDSGAELEFEFSELEPFLRGGASYGQKVPDHLKKYLAGGIEWADETTYGHRKAKR